MSQISFLRHILQSSCKKPWPVVWQMWESSQCLSIYVSLVEFPLIVCHTAPKYENTFLLTESLRQNIAFKYELINFSYHRLLVACIQNTWQYSKNQIAMKISNISGSMKVSTESGLLLSQKWYFLLKWILAGCSLCPSGTRPMHSFIRTPVPIYNNAFICLFLQSCANV